ADSRAPTCRSASLFDRRLRHLALHARPSRGSSDLAACAAAATFRRRCRRCRRTARRECALPGTRPWRRAWRSAGAWIRPPSATRSEEHTSELQSRENLVCRLLLEKKKKAAIV